MADNNAAPVGSGPPPDFSSLEGDLKQIESQYEPRVEHSEEEAQRLEQQAVAASQESVTRTEETAATQISDEDRQMQVWLNNTPTRQAYYSTAMHAAPVLAILTALGGKITRLNGQQMIAAQTGIIQGLNESSEQKFNEAMQQWKNSYEAMRDHQRQLESYHKLMLEAYAGRADAYQRAAEAARRMTGDLLRDEQKKTDSTIRSFQAQSAAWERVQKVDLANRTLAERAKHDIAEETKWKDASARAAQFPPEIREQLKQEDQRWHNDKAQRDEIAKSRMRYLSIGDTTDPDAKKAIMARLDEEDDALARDMDMAINSRGNILSAYRASQEPGPGRPAPLTPGTTTPPSATGQDPRRGVIARPGQPTPDLPPAAPQASSEAVQAPPGLPPENEKGWKLMHDPKNKTWAYVAPDGQYEIVKPPTVQ